MILHSEDAFYASLYSTDDVWCLEERDLSDEQLDYRPWNGTNTAGTEGHHMDRHSISTCDFFLPWLGIRTGGKHILVYLMATT